MYGLEVRSREVYTIQNQLAIFFGNFPAGAQRGQGTFKIGFKSSSINPSVGSAWKIIVWSVPRNVRLSPNIHGFSILLILTLPTAIQSYIGQIPWLGTNFCLDNLTMKWRWLHQRPFWLWNVPGTCLHMILNSISFIITSKMERRASYLLSIPTWWLRRKNESQSARRII